MSKNYTLNHPWDQPNKYTISYKLINFISYD